MSNYARLPGKAGGFPNRLSEQRAKAVKGWLFNEGGVPLERMKTAGKGSSEPVASNDAEEGRAKNRRIEFTVEGI